MKSIFYQGFFCIEIMFASLAISCLLGWAWIPTKTEGWSHRHPLYPRQQRQYQRGIYCYIQDRINFQYISRKFLFCSMKSEETVFLLPGGTQSWCRPWDGGLSWLVEVKYNITQTLVVFVIPGLAICLLLLAGQLVSWQLFLSLLVWRSFDCSAFWKL